MNYWLFKSEPDIFSLADLKARPGRREPWTGVRNYQARNSMRDQMKPGDPALFYHSSCLRPGVAGVMKIASKPYPDPTQFDPADVCFDPKASAEKPIWILVDVEWEREFEHFVPLETLRAEPALAEMLTLRRGNRLSITPVTAEEFAAVCRLGDKFLDQVS